MDLGAKMQLDYIGASQCGARLNMGGLPMPSTLSFLFNDVFCRILIVVCCALKMLAA